MKPFDSRIAFSVVVFCALFAVACGSARRSEPVAGPMVLRDPAQKHGQIVFMQQCNQCHPQGEGGLGGSINNKPFPAPMIKAKVRTGLGGDMPAFSDRILPDRDLDDLVAYLVAVRKHGG
jgi:mono/diheme cytochrome c family protein